MRGDADLAKVAALIADPARSRILIALTSGSELPAGVLAAEAGVSRSTASAHLRKLTEGGLLRVRTDGRTRRYRLAGAGVATAIERLLEIADTRPVTSLRESTRADQLRAARTCYDHLAGRLGVAVMRGMLTRGLLSGGDGEHRPVQAVHDRLAARGRDVHYQLTGSGAAFLDELGVRLAGGRRPVVRYCVDWTEGRHHLAGQLGRGLCDRFLTAAWVERRGPHRALRVTDAGASVLDEQFGVALS